MTDIPPDADSMLERDIADLKALQRNLERQGWERKLPHVRVAAGIIGKAISILDEHMNRTKKYVSPF